MASRSGNSNDTVGSSSSGATSASQAWAILKRHARDELAHLRLLELCRDKDRVSSLVTVYNSSDGDGDEHMIMVDLSRQRMTLETLNHLLRLAKARNMKDFITRLAWGPGNCDPSHPIVPKRVRTAAQKLKHNNDEADQGAGRNFPSNSSSSIPSYHLSLRAPKGSEMLLYDGTNVVTGIHSEWDRIQRVTDSLRRGQLPGVTGQMIRDVVVIGQGVSIMALRFVYLALCKDEQATIGRCAGMTDARRMQAASASAGQRHRRIKFITSMDPVRVAGVVADLDAATTLVVTIALTGNEETMVATGLLQSWLFDKLGVLNGRRPADQILSKHMVFVTGNERLGMQRKPETIFVLPEHSRSEPFSTFTAATLFPLAFVFGWPIVEKFIQGAHDMDSHFVETNPRHNLPVLLALTDVWNDAFLQSNGRIVTPFTDALAAYPAFCATLESQTCGNATGSAAMAVIGSQVVDGGLHHAYDRSLYQSTKMQPTELVMTLDSQIAANAAGIADMEEIHAAQDALLCSLFAHADELAFGSMISIPDGKEAGFLSPIDFGNNAAQDDYSLNTTLENTSEGNRPSVLVLCGRLDAFACGQFIALAEHRAAVKARLWDMDPFIQETGATLRSSRIGALKETLKTMFMSGGDDEEDDMDGMDTNLSTRTILRHYSNLMRDQRVYTINGGSS